MYKRLFVMTLVLTAVVAVSAGCQLFQRTAIIGQLPENAGILALTVNVKGAEIYIDGALYGTVQRAGVQQDIVVEAGEHKLTLKKFGYKEFTTTVGLVAGSVNTIDVTLERLPTEAVEVPTEEGGQ